jgi:hypothetical protein
MSEGLKEHAWKTRWASDFRRRRITATHTRSTSWAPLTITWCEPVSLLVIGSFWGFLSQPYHNQRDHLAPLTDLAPTRQDERAILRFQVREFPL